MYGKLFKSMYDGTLVEDWQALITFQQMIVLCDSAGTIDITPQALSRQTGIPIEYILAGIKSLEANDPQSRTSDMNGKRIERLDDHRDWGWSIVNYDKYVKLVSHEDKKRKDAERMREKRKKDKEISHVANSRNESQGVAEVAHIDIDIDRNIDNKVKTSCERKRPPVVPYDEIINIYHIKLPNNPKVLGLTNNRKEQIKARWNNQMTDLNQWENYFDDVSQNKFLTGRSPCGHNRSKPFIANIDFLINESNLFKIAEGKYND